MDTEIKNIETEYEILVEENVKEDVRVMCNLSQGIKEEGIALGKEEGIALGKEEGIVLGKAEFIISMYHKGYTLEQIADVAEKSIEEVKAVIKNRETALA